MITEIKVSAIYNCSLERAFKTPILCDITKVHAGFGLVPRVTHATGDGDWGTPGSSKNIHIAKSLFQKGGFIFVDRVIERNENQFWLIQLDDFQAWMWGFYKFVGKWKTTPIDDNKVQIDYCYRLYSSNALCYPFNWIFGKTLWKAYMKRVLKNVREMAYLEAPYLYE